MQKGTSRLVILVASVAVLVAGLMVVLSQIGGGGDPRELFADIPQNGPRLGQEDAPVTIQLYEDFQCPACAQFIRETFPQVVEQYVEPGEVRVVSEPLAFLGPDSVPAARAAVAAGEQDRYWQYAYRRFENQGAENSGYVTDEFLTDIAENTEGLDVNRWNEARDSEVVEEELEAAREMAIEDEIEATPTLVVSGPGGERKLRGAVPMEEVEAAVEEVKAG